MDCMGRLQAAGSVSVWTQSINQYLILRLQGETRHVSLCYDIVRYFRHVSDMLRYYMFQICYDIVRYFRHVSDMLRYCTLFQTCFRYVTILYAISDMFQICYDIVRYFRHIQDFGLSVGDRAFIQLLLFFVVYGTTKRSGGNSSIEDVSRSLTSMKHATEADHYQRT